MTDVQQIAEIQTLKARVDRLTTQGNEQARKIAELEKAGSAVQLQRLVELLEPVSNHAKNILAVQLGAMGVRP